MSAPSLKPAARKSAPSKAKTPAKDAATASAATTYQVRGLIDMVETGRSCEDVAQQMSAARKAMDKAFYRMMACSVMEAVSFSDSEDGVLREVERSTRILEKYS